MSSIQTIGQDFSSTVLLNLLPGIDLPRGIFQTNIQFITDVGGQITMHHISQNMLSNKDVVYSIGKDVRSIRFELYCHNSYPSNPMIHYRYDMRIDRLILLNLAIKLLK